MVFLKRLKNFEDHHEKRMKEKPYLKNFFYIVRAILKSNSMNKIKTDNIV